MSFSMAYAIDSLICEVVESIGALLIHENTVIDMAHLTDCQVSCDWVIFIKFNQWHALFEPLTVIPNMLVLLMTTDH